MSIKEIVRSTESVVSTSHKLLAELYLHNFN